MYDDVLLPPQGHFVQTLLSERERELQHFECSLLLLLRLTEREKNNPQRKQDLACSLRFPSQHSCGVGDFKPSRV
jgi:hypothetical protein